MVALARRHVVLVASLVLLTSAQARGIMVDDLRFIVGDGDNLAVMVFDWRDSQSPEALAWGYRFDDGETVGDMLRAIAGRTVVRLPFTGMLVEESAGADPRLFLALSRFSFDDSLFGIGYDADGDGGDFLPGVEGAETGAATDPDDRYQEGFFDNGFWVSTISEDGENFGADRDGDGFADFAAPALVLEDGLFYGWTFDSDFSFDVVPGDIAAAAPPAVDAPEPSSALLCLAGGVLLGVARRKRAN